MATLNSVYAKQYGSNIYMLSQQKGSVLRNYVTIEAMKGEKRTFERIKPTTAVEVTSKYQESPIIETQFDRRTVHGKTYAWGDMLDWGDDLNTLIDPSSAIVRAGGYALGRVIDDIIVNGAFVGKAYEGKEGLTEVDFPESQKIPVTVGGSGGNSGLNVPKLLEIRSRFGLADIDLDDPENEVYIAVTQRQLDDLARSVDISNKDYDIVRALYEEKTDKLFGINFVRIGQARLPQTSVSGGISRMCPAWVKSGVVCVLPKEIEMTIGQRLELMNNWYALGKMKAGATRIDDAKVLQVHCFEEA